MNLSLVVRYVATAALLLPALAGANNVTNITSGGPAYATITGAVAAANPGDTLRVRANVFHEKVSITKPLAIRGGYNAAFTVQTGLTTITNISTAGSVIEIESAQRVFLDRLRVEGGNPTLHGGAVYVSSSTGIFEWCELRNSRASRGGGIYALSAVVVLSNTHVRNNVAMQQGGGIRALNSRVHLDYGCLVGENTAAVGGGVALGNGSRGKLGSDVTVYKNIAAVAGGGVAVQNSSLHVAGEQVTPALIGILGGANRVTNGDGGGIYAVDATVTLAPYSALDANEASGYGGGIYVSNSVLVGQTTQIGSFSADSTNRAVRGGGICALDATVILSNGTIVLCGAASYVGGGIYSERGSLILVDAFIGGPGGYGNAANQYAGGVYTVDTAVQVVNAVIQANSAGNAVGGAAFVGSADVSLSNVLLNANVSPLYGGLYMNVARAPQLAHLHVVSNVAYWYGGGYVVVTQPVSVAGLQARYNWAVSGAGFLLHAVTTGDLWQAEVAHNRANDSVAGLYLIGEGVARATDCRLRNNIADNDNNGVGNGGGLVVSGNVEWHARTAGSDISDNRAQAGAGVYVMDNTRVAFVAVTSAAPVVINDNRATVGGGLMASGAATATLYGAVVISSNRAVCGGGVALSNMAALIARPTNGIGQDVAANIARLAGGGLWLHGRTTSVDALALAIRGNRAHGASGSTGGGGLWLEEGAAGRLKNALIAWNVSSNIGGGVVAAYGAEVEIGSDFSAGSGAGAVPPTRIAGNHAVEEVGGVYAYHGSRITCRDAQIISNTSEDVCGGFAVLAATGRLINVIIAHNRGNASLDGLAFQNAPDALVQQCTIVDNHALGVWSWQSTPVKLENTIIWGHTSNQIMDVGVTSAVNFCAIQGGYPGLFNITNNPAFVNRAALDFQLDFSSPCIDKGATLFTVTNDCIGALRPYGLGWDIGAYEFVPEPAGLIAALLCAVVCRGAHPNRQRRAL